MILGAREHPLVRQGLELTSDTKELKMNVVYVRNETKNLLGQTREQVDQVVRGDLEEQKE